MPKKHSPRQNALWNHEMAMVVTKVKVTEHDGYKSYQVVEKKANVYQPPPRNQTRTKRWRKR